MTAQEKLDTLRSFKSGIEKQIFELNRITRYCPVCDCRYHKEEFTSQKRTVKAEICVDIYEQEYEIEDILVEFYKCPKGHEHYNDIGRYHLLQGENKN